MEKNSLDVLRQGKENSGIATDKPCSEPSGNGMDKRLNSLELLGEAMDMKRNAKKRHRLALLSEAMDMKSIAWRYSVKQWHIFEKSRKAKEMKANEIYS